jgi:RNA polymerase sigma-70 factor (ECF subfamily)
MALALDLLTHADALPPSASHETEIRTMTKVPLAGQGRPLDEDDQLLRLIAQHDEPAFRKLVERHIDRAFGLALRILRNAADAEDVERAPELVNRHHELTHPATAPLVA